MRNLVAADVDEVKKRLAAGVPLHEIVPDVLGDTLLGNGFWRIFGRQGHGPLSLGKWNSPELWKNTWNGLASMTFWGEDVFGNQLIIDGEGKLYLWDHENASAVPTGFDLLLITETSIDHGLGWIDFYSDGSYSLVEGRLNELPFESHWHWIQPRILGGQVTAGNLTAIERVQHMVGHGKLWLQVRSISPGD